MDLLLLLFCLAIGLSGALLLKRQRARARVVERLFAGNVDGSASVVAEGVIGFGSLRRWLIRAGYRSRSAPTTFVLLAISCAAVGGAAALLVYRSGLGDELARGVEAMPGGIGLAFVPLIQAAPLFIGLLVAAAPWLVVRRRRRRLAAEVERDLPIFLELLATLVESGLAFDAAVAQLLDSEPEPRQLAREMRLFQLEIRSGRSRLACFQRLRDRVDVPSLTILVSALITAEQLGASIAEVLRTQADDIRSRRREQALAHAQTAPVKLVFPLFFCFLPGLFVSTLGPAIYQIFQAIDNVIGGR